MNRSRHPNRSRGNQPRYQFASLTRLARTAIRVIRDHGSTSDHSASVTIPGCCDRIIRSRWTKDLATDLDFVSFEIGYDPNSNSTSTEDLVYSAGFDVKYAIDDLNRLTDADKGTLASGSITTQTRRQQWLLDQVGNWENDQLDLNGDGVLTGPGELDEVRTHNLGNEILTREPDGGLPFRCPAGSPWLSFE